jgi:hypothetical protein
VCDELRLFDTQVVVEEVQQLLLHQVDLGEREESTVLLPVHVLWRRVVKVLGGTDEYGEEDSVSGALHAWWVVSLGKLVRRNRVLTSSNSRQLLLKSLQV